MKARLALASVLVLTVNFVSFLKGKESETSGDVDEFRRWFDDRGGKCRCKFLERKDHKLTAIADRRIVDKEPILVVPESLQVNSATIEKSTIGPTLEQLSLLQHQILKHPDYLKRQVMQLMQMAIFVLYSVHTSNEQWLPYFNTLVNHHCNALWMWSEDELSELQNERLTERAVEWNETASRLAAKITPKLNRFGLFDGKELTPDTLINAVCAVQSNSYNITNHSGHPVRTLVPGLNMFTYRPIVGGKWWTEGDALHYRHVNTTIEEGDTIFIDINPNGDSTQTLLEYGLFVSDGSKFFTPLPEQKSRIQRRFVDMLKLNKKIKFSEKFTFEATGLPSLRVHVLPDKEVNNLVKAGSNPSKLIELEKIFNSPSLHVESNPSFSCKYEMIAVNLLMLHLKDEMIHATTTISQDKEILTRDIPTRQRIAVEFRWKFKELVSNYFNITRAQAIEMETECLSRKRDEL